MTFSKYPKISRVITFKIHCVVILYFYLINSTLPTRDYLFSYISLSRERLAVLKLEMMIKKRGFILFWSSMDSATVFVLVVSIVLAITINLMFSMYHLYLRSNLDYQHRLLNILFCHLAITLQSGSLINILNIVRSLGHLSSIMTYTHI